MHFPAEFHPRYSILYLPGAEYYDHQKNYDMKTLKHKVKLKGETQGAGLTTLQEESVKSHQELVIANFMTLNGIWYLYEEPYRYNTANYAKRQYRPDFYLPDYDIYIEHFGIDRNGKTAPYIDNKAYIEGMKWKVSLHKKYGTTLMQTFSYKTKGPGDSDSILPPSHLLICTIHYSGEHNQPLIR